MDKATEEVFMLARMSDEDREKYFMALPPDKTSSVLIADLEQKPQSAARDKIIEKAKTYHYDDFKCFAMEDICPKITLVRHLTQAGFHDLAYNTKAENMTELDEKIELMNRAIDEINQLRHTNEILSAKVQTMDLFALVLRTEPKYPSQGYAEDITWKMQRYLDNQKTRPEKA